MSACMVVFVLMMVLLYCFIVKYGVFCRLCEKWCFVVVMALFSRIVCVLRCCF